MAETQTMYVNFERLNKSKHGPLVIRLMMAFNDFGLANLSLADWKKEQAGYAAPVQNAVL